MARFLTKIYARTTTREKYLAPHTLMCTEFLIIALVVSSTIASNFTRNKSDICRIVVRDTRGYFGSTGARIMPVLCTFGANYFEPFLCRTTLFPKPLGSVSSALLKRYSIGLSLYTTRVCFFGVGLCSEGIDDAFSPSPPKIIILVIMFYVLWLCVPTHGYKEYMVSSYLGRGFPP